jgi:hypothetical protein
MEPVRSGIGTLIYVVVGAFVAGAHHYFQHLGSLKPIISGLLAIFLCPDPARDQPATRR